MRSASWHGRPTMWNGSTARCGSGSPGCCAPRCRSRRNLPIISVPLQRFALERMDWQDFNSAMAAYSLDLRERIVEAVERQVGSKRKIADLFGVHESFIYKLLRQKRERGDIAPLPHGGGAQAKLSEEQRQVLPDLIAATP